MFEMVDVSKKVKKKHLIRDVNLKVHAGEVVAVIGPNGAGKSTMIKCLAGTMENSSGNILYKGKDIKTQKANELAKTRAYLSQHHTPSFNFTVMDTVMMGRFPYCQQRPGKYDREVVTQAMDRTGILHLENRLVQTLSGGEMQRVNFARTLAQIESKDSEPKLLLLDEPVNNLDPRYQHGILETSLSIAREGKTGVLTVLHDLNLAAAYADRVIMMAEGLVQNEGLPEKVLTSENLEPLYGLPFSVFRHGEELHISCGRRPGVVEKKEIHETETYI